MHSRANAQAVTRRAATAIALLSALLMAGCAGIAPLPVNTNPTIPTEAASIHRTYSDTLDMRGRLSVHYQNQNNGRDEAVYVSFTWSQTRQHSTITILSPLGQTLATIEVGPDSATLIQSGQAARTASDVDILAAESLGWPLPVSGLRHWLQGFATDANNQPFIASSANAANEVITREGWRIQYVTWQDDPQTPAQSRPKRIDLERQTEQAGKVVIRIVIDHWQAH